MAIRYAIDLTDAERAALTFPYRDFSKYGC